MIKMRYPHSCAINATSIGSRIVTEDALVWVGVAMSSVANALLVGIEQGALYALVALGLIVVYSAAKVFNFAHGNLVMGSAVLTDVLWQSFKMPVVAAMALSVVAVVAVGWLTERFAVRPAMAAGNSERWVLSTYGVSVIIGAAFTIALSSGDETTTQRFFPSYLPFRAGHVGSVIVDPNKLFVVAVAAVVAVSLWLFLGHTVTGRALRAVADDRDAAQSRGIAVRRVTTLSFVVGALVAAITGFVAGPVIQADVTVGTNLLIYGFFGAAIGGMESIEGAVVGSLVFGLIGSFTAQFTNGQLIDPLSLLALLVILSVRPQGLLGRTGRAV